MRPNGPAQCPIWHCAGHQPLTNFVREVVATLELQILDPIDIATDRCKGCGLCIDACPKHVLELDETVVNALGYHPAQLTDAAGCTSCAICARICPDTVFTIYAPPKGGQQ